MHWRGILQQYTSFGPDDERRDYESGLKHGSSFAGQNASEVLLSGIERIETQIATDANAFQASYLRDLNHEKNELTRIGNVHVNFVSEKAGIYNEIQRKENEIDLQFGQNTEKYRQLSADFNAAKENFDRLRYELRRLPYEALNVRFYWMIIVILFLIEIPINAIAFQLLNEVHVAMSAFMALVFGLLLFMLTHFSGIGFRRVWGAPSLAQGMIRLAWPICGFFFLLLLILALAHLREQVFQIENSARPVVVGRELGPIVSRATAALWERFFRLTEVGQQIAALNALLVVFAVIAAFFKADPDARYDTANKLLKQTKRKFEEFQLTAQNARVQIQSSSNSDISTIEVALRDTEKQMRQIEESVRIMQEQGRAAVGYVVSVRSRRTSAYRQGFLHGLHASGHIGSMAGLPKGAASQSDSDASPEDQAKSGQQT